MRRGGLRRKNIDAEEELERWIGYTGRERVDIVNIIRWTGVESWSNSGEVGLHDDDLTA